MSAKIKGGVRKSMIFGRQQRVEVEKYRLMQAENGRHLSESQAIREMIDIAHRAVTA